MPKCLKCNKESTENFPEGITTIAQASYGSIYDGEVFKIFVCDNCIKDNKPTKYEIVIRKTIDTNDWCFGDTDPEKFVRDVVKDNGIDVLKLNENDIERVRPI